MGLLLHHDKIDAAAAAQLTALCPFGALAEENGRLTVSPACRLCMLCVKKGPAGAVTFEKEKRPVCDKAAWNGVAVFAEQRGGKVHPVSLELVGKARELAAVTGHPVLAVLIGSGVKNAADELLSYGVDRVYVYDHPACRDFVLSPYAACFTDFIERVKPSSILVGATLLGRSLAPKVAARVRAGLTADCTMLEMKENTDLVQIRPAFGGNIMARIVTPNSRPQFCTVRYKIFSAPAPCALHGEILSVPVTDDLLTTKTRILSVTQKPAEADISDAEVIVAVGRGIRSREDIGLAQQLADRLGAQLACTRPLVEAGWFDPRRQIGLSGRTVKPKLIVTLGVSGSVQFAAGMRNSPLIVAVNSDKNAPIFDIAHYGFVGDLYQVIPLLIQRMEENGHV